MINIGIVGVGGTVSIARSHLSGILKDGRGSLTAVYNRSREPAEKFLQDFGIDAKICASYEELLQTVDAVIVCTPNSTHFGFAKRAIEMNKHLLLEKPVAVSIEEAKILKELSEKHEGVHMVGFSYRYASAAVLAKKLIAENFSRVYTVNCHFGGKRLANPNVPMEWRFRKETSGSGALGDFGSHLLDMVRHLTGEEFSEVKAFSETFIKERRSGEGTEAVENDDASALILRSRNTVATFIVSRVGAPDMRISLAGDGGFLDIDFGRPSRVVYHKKEKNGPYLPEKFVEEFDEDSKLWIEREVADFFDAIEGKGGEYARIGDGYYVQELLGNAETNLV